MTKSRILGDIIHLCRMLTRYIYLYYDQ